MYTEMNVLAMAKRGGAERYVFLYDNSEKSLRALFEVFTRFTDNPDFNFTAIDQEFLIKKACEMREWAGADRQ